jgi:excinuclease ABC subunit C
MKRHPKDGTASPTLFPVEAFDGLGPSRFRPHNEAITGCQLRGKRPLQLRKGVQDHAPRLPGVYGMLDDRGRIIYVGKAKNLRSRLLSYFRTNSRDPKAGRIIQHTRMLVWEQTGDEFAALLRELELIQTLRPRFNVLGLPGLQRHHYICIGKSPAAYVYVTNKPTGKETGIYGPLLARSKSDDAVRRLNDWFKLRDCPQTVAMAFSDQPEIFPHEKTAKCMRFELETCSGPCAGACSRKEYGVGVRGVKAFLDGRDRAILSVMKTRMDEAAADYEFEKATSMRDRLQTIEWLDARLSLIRQARTRNSFVYPLVGTDGRERWYLINRGQVRAVCFSPGTEDEFKFVSEMLSVTFSDRPEAIVLTGGNVDSVLLVAAWFRKYANERTKLMTKQAAVERCNKPT